MLVAEDSRPMQRALPRLFESFGGATLEATCSFPETPFGVSDEANRVSGCSEFGVRADRERPTA
jgi:hypothetical protein